MYLYPDGRTGGKLICPATLRRGGIIKTFHSTNIYLIKQTVESEIYIQIYTLLNRQLKSTCTQSPFVESNNIFSPCLSPSPKIYPTILITAAVRAYDTLALYLNKYKHYNLLIIKASQMKEVSQME